MSDMGEHDRLLRRSVSNRVTADGLVPPGATVLCLGARSGAEVLAFLDRGCFAVGIDLNPGAHSSSVLYGDFQKIQWPAASVDVVFTNSLDHAFDINVVLGEIIRVLSPSGIVIVEAVRGIAEGHPPGVYESFYWHTTDDLVSLLTSQGLNVLKRYPFDEPWNGEHIVLQPMSSTKPPV